MVKPFSIFTLFAQQARYVNFRSTTLVEGIRGMLSQMQQLGTLIVLGLYTAIPGVFLLAVMAVAESVTGDAKNTVMAAILILNLLVHNMLMKAVTASDYYAFDAHIAPSKWLQKAISVCLLVGVTPLLLISGLIALTMTWEKLVLVPHFLMFIAAQCLMVIRSVLFHGRQQQNVPVWVMLAFIVLALLPIKSEWFALGACAIAILPWRLKLATIKPIIVRDAKRYSAKIIYHTQNALFWRLGASFILMALTAPLANSINETHYQVFATVCLSAVLYLWCSMFVACAPFIARYQVFLRQAKCYHAVTLHMHLFVGVIGLLLVFLSAWVLQLSSLGGAALLVPVYVCVLGYKAQWFSLLWLLGSSLMLMGVFYG